VWRGVLTVRYLGERNGDLRGEGESRETGFLIKKGEHSERGFITLEVKDRALID